VIWFPRISNFTDYHGFDYEPDVTLRYLRKVPNRLPDAVILPGTKSTMADLAYLKKSGFAAWIRECLETKVPVVGICGGFQMLGEKISDPDGVEGHEREALGLGLLPIKTVFEPEKITKQVRVKHLLSGIELKSYEIHMGREIGRKQLNPVFQKEDGTYDGAITQEGLIWGTYLHDVFQSDAFRRWWINQLRSLRGFEPLREDYLTRGENAFDRMADLVRENIDVSAFYEILKTKQTIGVT